MHSYNFNIKDPTNKFIYIAPFALQNNLKLIDQHLVKPYVDAGGELKDLTVLFLSPTQIKDAAYYKKQLSLLTKLFKAIKPKVICILDSQLFTKLTGQKSPTKFYGLPIKCKLEDSPNTLCFLGVNPQATFISDKLSQALVASTQGFVKAAVHGSTGFKPQSLKSIKFLHTLPEIIENLKEYHKLPIIACDIETKSLKHTKTGIETIAFAKSPYEGICIAVDRNETADIKAVNAVIRQFFIKFTGKIIWHGGKFDRKIITHTYYNINKSPMYRVNQHEDTMVMAYCCLNSVEKPLYGLKGLVFEFLGDYSVDVNDTTKIELQKLMDYNLHDACGTFYLFEKYSPMLVSEGQEEIYQNLFLPSLTTLIRTELHGIPVSPEKVQEFKTLLFTDRNKNLLELSKIPLINEFTVELRQAMCDKRNSELKTKQLSLADFSHIKFNPSSSKQLNQLLYKKLGLPVLNYTKKKQPSTDKDTLELLILHAQSHSPEVWQIVHCLAELSKCKTLIATFIPILEEAITENLKDGVGYIYGNFNIPGTVSGRLSSSDPNLQNMPSTGTKYAKAFKACLIAPPNKVVMAIDFDSLEDRISAKTTQDPNKLKVYTEGYDGHSLRAYYYYPEYIKNKIETPESINSIAQDHPDLRQDSKPITFALTYLGTYTTLMRNCGLSEADAKRIEENYHKLYAVSDKYIQKKLEQAAKDGYIVGAFGFKLRAEILKSVLISKHNTPHQIQKMLRTLGNMLGQSYGLLNSRAANEVMEATIKCDIVERVYPIAQIHDAQYYIVDNDPKLIAQFAKILEKAVSWQDLPELQQDPVKISGTAQISYDSWGGLKDI